MGVGEKVLKGRGVCVWWQAVGRGNERWGQVGEACVLSAKKVRQQQSVGKGQTEQVHGGGACVRPAGEIPARVLRQAGCARNRHGSHHSAKPG